MGQFQHCYSDYIHHILNRSPSKTAYSFSRAERFPQAAPKEFVPSLNQSSDLSCPRHSGQSHRNYNNNIKPPLHACTRQQLNDRKSKEKSKPYGVNYQLDQLIRKIQLRQSRSKSRSGSKQHHKQFNPYLKNKSPTKNSPTKKIQKRRESRTPSPVRKTSPSKSYYQRLKQLDHPSQNITITGYYPVGTEISPTGKYASSRIKNVVGMRFSPERPRREKNSQFLPFREPGHYPAFSQFGAR